LCAIIDAEVAARDGWTIGDLASAYLAGGAKFLQVRAKREAGGWFLESAVRVVQLARPAGATVIVNDRADIAKIAAADGVHVGQHDLPPAAARVILGDTAMIGLSTHTTDQIGAAVAQPISYVAIGPMFGSATKATGYQPVGPELVARGAPRCRAAGKGIVAIGGITLDLAESVIQSGADAVAVISDLLSTGNPEARVRAYLDRLSGRSAS
jgi:thiamine-phosphate pyrophosphorylase